MATNIKYYRTNLGVILQQIPPKYCSPEDLRLNGCLELKKDGRPLNKGWILLEGVNSIEKIEGWVQETKTRAGYRLRDPELASNKIPLELDPNYLGAGGENYGHLDGLYEPFYEIVPGNWEECENTGLEYLGHLEIENLSVPEKVFVTMTEKEGWGTTQKEVDLGSVVIYDDLVEMLTPEFMLHTKPCSLSSEQVYKIIRAHILDNINSKYAYVSSNYDFCFEVKKKVRHKPIEVSKEVYTPSGRSYKTPRFRKDIKTERLFSIFEMTHKGNNYKGYTPIAGWSADSLEDMVKQIGVYLDHLIETINAPLVECEACCGKGYIVEKIPTNGNRNT